MRASQHAIAKVLGESIHDSRHGVNPANDLHEATINRLAGRFAIALNVRYRKRFYDIVNRFAKG